jgi:hypothetical protein
MPFALVQLLGTGAGPVALIWLETPDESCCKLVHTVAIPSGRVATKSFGHARAHLELVNGLQVFVSADDRFAAAFTSLALSGLPVRVWRYRAATFADVTQRFRGLVAADAAHWWQRSQLARNTRRDARGFFAAWAASTCRLGKRAAVTRELGAAVAAGVFAPARAVSGPTGARYATVLRTQLRAWGYCA